MRFRTKCAHRSGSGTQGLFGKRSWAYSGDEPTSPMKNKNQNESDPFFAEPVDPRVEARTQASEAICCLLIWMADAPTLEDRGLRATVALYCIRPDLIGGATLEKIGSRTGCTRQAVHKLADNFRVSMGLKS